MYAASVEYLNRQQIIPNWGGGYWEQWYVYCFSFFSFCECVCVSLCVWFCLYSFAFTICPRLLSVRFLFCCCCCLIFLNNYFLFFILITLLYFTLLYFNFFVLSFFFFSLLFWAVCMTGSWFSSQASGLCLWGGRAKFRTLVHKRSPSST